MEATMPTGSHPRRLLAWRRVSFAQRATALLLAGVSLGSCGGQRVLQVTSEPSGALVRLDEDVIGTTPLKYDFEHFGRRRLSLYLPGFQSYSEPIHLKTPWHATFPIDVVTEVLLPLGLRYKRSYHIKLVPDDGERVRETLDTFIQRAESIRQGLPGQAAESEAAPSETTEQLPRP